jgi:hypothetical protein
LNAFTRGGFFILELKPMIDFEERFREQVDAWVFYWDKWV